MFDHFFGFYCLRLLSSPKRISFVYHINSISMPWALAFFYLSIYFASPTAKPVGPCQWIT
jgi:hypothetical protein